jgi:hypothetical protein
MVLVLSHGGFCPKDRRQHEGLVQLHCTALHTLKASNGPDVHVYLFATDDARDSESVKRAAFVDLGSIKGNIGDQNYTLGSDVDLSKYRTVSVWCKRFSVNFGAAPLSTDRVAQR